MVALDAPDELRLVRFNSSQLRLMVGVGRDLDRGEGGFNSSQLRLMVEELVVYGERIFWFQFQPVAINGRHARRRAGRGLQVSIPASCD